MNTLDSATLFAQRKHLTYLRFLYPLWMVFGIFSLIYVPSSLLVLDDVAVTASNISSNPLLFRMGIAASLLTQITYIFAALFLYRLFAPVDKNQSVLMLVLALVAVPIAMLNGVNQIAALLLTSGPEYLSDFTADQLNAAMMFFLELNGQGINIASIFWGLWLFPLGCLAYKSGYFPKFIGVAQIVAGVGYTAGAFIVLIFPDANTLLSIVEPMTVGEVIFIAWIVIMGAKFPSDNSIE